MKDLEWLNYWMSDAQIKKQLRYNSSSNLAKLEKTQKNRDCQFTLNPPRHYPAAEHNLMRVARENQSVEFVVVIAPMTRQWLSEREPRFLTRYFGFHKYLVSQAEALSNVRIYGFENDDQIVSNIANFRDSMHFHSGVNDRMLEAISRDEHNLNGNNIDRYLADILMKKCSYNVQSDFSTMIPLALDSERKMLLKLR